jgi:hypothetical protein
MAGLARQPRTQASDDASYTPGTVVPDHSRDLPSIAASTLQAPAPRMRTASEPNMTTVGIGKGGTDGTCVSPAGR